MSTPDHAAACLQDFFAATAALQPHATRLDTSANSLTFDAYAPSFDLPRFKTRLEVPSRHGQITLIPLLQSAQERWTQFVAAAYACAPVLHTSALRCTQHARISSIADTEPMNDRFLMFYVRTSCVVHHNTARCVEAIRTLLCALQGLPAGDQPFVVTCTAPSPTGTPNVFHDTISTRCIEDATSVWHAVNAYHNHTYTLRGITPGAHNA